MRIFTLEFAWIIPAERSLLITNVEALIREGLLTMQLHRWR
jgi:hypothetical protein